MNRGLHILLCIAVIAVGGGATWLLVENRREVVKEEARSPPPLVRARVVEPESRRVIVRSQGTVRPRTSSHLVPEVSGRIVWVSPSWAEGGYFEKGEALLRIDRTDYELALVAAKAQVAQAELRLAQEEQEAAVARKEWESVGAKRADPPPLVLREPQLREARAALEAASSRRKQAEIDLQRTEVAAPFAGRLLERLVDIGQYVARGSPVAKIYAVDYAEVRLPVPDDEIGYLDLPLHYRGEKESDRGPEVTIRASFAGKEQEWKGYIVRTEGQIDTRSRMVHVVARVDDPYGRGEDPDRPPLAVGLFVEANIAGNLLENVCELPRHALRETSKVLVIDADDRLRFREVEVLRSHGSTALIRCARSPGEGLVPGERVCISPIPVVVDGMKVRVEEERPESDGERSREAGP